MGMHGVIEAVIEACSVGGFMHFRIIHDVSIVVIAPTRSSAVSPPPYDGQHKRYNFAMMATFTAVMPVRSFNRDTWTL